MPDFFLHINYYIIVVVVAAEVDAFEKQHLITPPSHRGLIKRSFAGRHAASANEKEGEAARKKLMALVINTAK